MGTQFPNYSITNFRSDDRKIGRWVLGIFSMLNKNMKKNKCKNRPAFEIFEKNLFIQAVLRNFINKNETFKKVQLLRIIILNGRNNKSNLYSHNFCATQDSN